MTSNLKNNAQELLWQTRIFDSLSYPSVIIAPDKTIISANKQFIKKFKLSLDDISGQKCFTTFLYKDTPCNSDKCPISKVCKTKISHSFSLERRHRWEERVFSPILNDAGDVAYIISSMRDVTQTKSLESELVGVKEFMASVLHGSASAIVAADIHGKIELMNPVAKKLFGVISQGKNTTTHTEHLYPLGRAKEIMRMLRDEKISGKGKLLIPGTTVINAEGEKIIVDMSAAIIYDEHGNETATMAIYNDLKDKIAVERKLKYTQEQLAQSEKMASLGQLAAGVAHEINNPLTGVLFYASLLEERKDIDDSMKEDLSYIIEDANRCKDIVKSLLVYSRSTDSHKRIIQINEVIKQSLKLTIDQKIFGNIEIKQDFSDEMMLINVDINKFNQVIINLAINASDAMDGKGVLSLHTYRNKPDKKVFLEIRDTGSGIPYGNLSKIFDPFFTTKQIGKSTGLGLSIVYGILEEHNAEISVKETGSKGTIFLLEFPLYLPSEESPFVCSNDSLDKQDD